MIFKSVLKFLVEKREHVIIYVVFVLECNVFSGADYYSLWLVGCLARGRSVGFDAVPS